MSILADYRVLSDPNISPALVNPNDFKDFSLLLPSNFFQAGDHLPVLFFRLDTGVPNNLTFRVQSANALAPAFVTQLTATFSSDVAHSVHEVVNINNLQSAVNNTIRFQRLSGTGALIISDIVLWYKRNVTSTNLTITP